jgi:general secretion pathway protein D
MLLAGCAAERLHRQGLAKIERGEYEAGVADLHQALEQDPGNIAYRLDYEARRDGSVQRLIGLADSARGMGHFDTSAALYQRVLTLDPSNVRAQRGLSTIEAVSATPLP